MSMFRLVLALIVGIRAILLPCLDYVQYEKKIFYAKWPGWRLKPIPNNMSFWVFDKKNDMWFGPIEGCCHIGKTTHHFFYDEMTSHFLEEVLAK